MSLIGTEPRVSHCGGLIYLHCMCSDCGRMNIMMEGTMYPNGWHPTQDSMKPNFTFYRKNEIYSRTERPPKYYLIDFGISRRYDPAQGPPLEDPIHGGDKTVPEHQGRKGIIPCNPFFTDIYYAGNMIRTEFLEVGFLYNLQLECSYLTRVFRSRTSSIL